MTILILTSSFPRSQGDLSGNFILELTKRLSAKYDMIVTCPHSGGSELYEEIDRIKVLRFPYFLPLNLQRLYADGGIAYNFQRSFLAKVQAPLFVISELVSVALNIRRYQVNVINSHWLIPQGIVGAICRKIFKRAHILTIHSSEITLLKSIPFGKIIAEFCLNNSDAIVSVSKHRFNAVLDLISEDLRDQMITKASIIPMGVDINSFNLESLDKSTTTRSSDSQFTILFIGRLVEVKGCEYLIRALKLIVDKISDINLIIIGDGPLNLQLKELTSDLGLEGHVKFEGYINHDSVPEYYAQSDIVVFPSIIDSAGFEEGLPVVLVEATAAGKAIIATKTNGVLEVINDRQNGLLVDPKSPEQIAEMIELLYMDKDLCERLGTNAALSAKKYDWDVIADLYLDLIRSLELRT
jgi:glycosyltransferase involved in cell wall biosynthesis